MDNIASLTGEARASAQATVPAQPRESAYEHVAGEQPSTDGRGTVAVSRKRSTGVLCATFTPNSGRRPQALGLAYVSDLGFVHVDASDDDLAAVGLQRIPAPKATKKPASK